MREIGPHLSEVMFVLNVIDHDVGTLQVTGAHFKTESYVLREDGTTFGHAMSSAKSLDLANPAELALINPLNAAVIGELNEVKAQLNQAQEAGQLLETEHNALIVTHNESMGQLQTMTARAADLDRELGHVTRERDEALAREQVLTEAAEAAEADRQALLETLGERSVEIQALQLEVKYLQARVEQLILAGQQPSAAANLS